MIEISYLKEFQSDLKTLLKKYRTLQSDINNFIQYQLKPFHLKNIDNNGIFKITNTGIDYPIIYKVKKFASASFKGKGNRSGIRIIYLYYYHLHEVKFLEIYYKEKSNTDFNKKRLLKILKKL